MGSFLKRTLAAFSVFAGIPVAFGLLMSAAEQWASNMVYQAFGWTGIVLTGVVGTPVHEVGHYLSCRLFGLPVTEVALFRPVEGRAGRDIGLCALCLRQCGSLAAAFRLLCRCCAHVFRALA